ncbi:MAG TPA: hypothetical protein VMT34_03575, partial [Aggregatilineales bacterium]|nr:hypothetical protein [Aggregatilineales bacterium]
MKRWIEPETPPLSDALIAACGGDTLLASILWRRGYRDPGRAQGFLSPDAYSPAPPEALPDL